MPGQGEDLFSYQPAPRGFREPSRDCPLCPRLVAFREGARAREPGWFNAPVPSYGPREARLLIVGLAPGLRGANRTGRPFTGDYAGDLLFETLIAFGFARGRYEKRPDDGLTLIDARITNAVRCVPPENKPIPAEIKTCRQFLAGTLAEMSKLRAIVALGRIAHDSVVTALGARAPTRAVRARRRAHARRPQDLRHLPLLAPEHEHRPAHARHVPRSVCSRANLSRTPEARRSPPRRSGRAETPGRTPWSERHRRSPRPCA